MVVSMRLAFMERSGNRGAASHTALQVALAARSGVTPLAVSAGHTIRYNITV